MFLKNWLEPLNKLIFFHAVFKSPTLWLSLMSTQGNKSPVIWILLKRVCTVPAFWNSKPCAKRLHSSWFSDADKKTFVISVMKIKLKQDPWYIAPCSIKIKLSRSVTKTADDSNSGYMQAYETMSLKAFVLQSCLGAPESMLISCTDRSIAERILRYNIQS